jgi:two-component system nitrogen regulation response regulator NtrX
MKKTILIIDDEPAILRSMSDIFSDEGYNVICAEDGSQALSLLEKETPDLIFLDIWLPDSDGLKLLPGLKKEHPQVPIIMISGHGTIETAVLATKMGAFDFIEKPLSLDKLVITASNALALSRLQEENVRLKRQYSENRLLGNSEAIVQLREQLRVVAPTDGWVLIIGESGTGKELVAREIHRLSQRHEQPFVSINCAAIADDQIEAELFGFEKGAFPGAERRRKGKFELGNGGTIFLDEISSLTTAAQARILQVLEDGAFTRLGGDRSIPIDIRIIAATDKELEAEIEAGRFSRELFLKLNILPIPVPPLRARRDDIPLLAEFFLSNYFKNHGGSTKHLSPEVLERLSTYQWPGNVRELKNLMERLSIMCSSELIRISDLPPYLREDSPAGADSEQRWQELFATNLLTEATKNFEKLFIAEKLRLHDGNISKTAEAIGMNRRNLQRKIKTLKITQTD